MQPKEDNQRVAACPGGGSRNRQILYRLVKRWLPVLVTVLILSVGAAGIGMAAVMVVDAYGQQLVISRPPQRVVSLVPGATEMLTALGLEDRLQGVTLYDAAAGKGAPLPVVGGFLAPNVQAVQQREPDCLIVADIQQEVLAAFAGRGIPVLQLQARTVEDIMANVRLLGEIFQRSQEAEAICWRLQEGLDLIAKKIAKIPPGQRPRVVRLMSDRAVVVPGDDSFQNDLIRRAGGIPPLWGRNGAVIPVSPEAWQRFNPQVVYGCGPGLPTFAPLLRRPGYDQVEAVQRGRFLNFPCALTCRASVHAGDFVAWLAASLFTAEFSDPNHTVLPQQVLSRRPVPLDLPLVSSAEIVTSRILDFEHKTLLIQFRAPTAVLSTLEGPREGIVRVGNHYTPPPGWPLSHHRGLQADRRLVYGVLGCPEQQTSFLFTGADMDKVAISKEQFQELTVYALATAGVEGNALRLGRDEGRFYEPGTINIIVMSNFKLSPRAMSRALLDITEAKTAALQDLDIRSTEQPRWQATGTGTDNVIVVSGQGRQLDNAGGHSKLGELLGKAVYRAVREAVGRQNGVVGGRPVWRRIQERRLDLYELLPSSLPTAQRQRLVAGWDELLTRPESAGFLEAALALSDAWEQGQITDLSAYERWCQQVAETLAGRPLLPEEWPRLPEELPKPLRLAGEAILSGVGGKER